MDNDSKASRSEDKRREVIEQDLADVAREGNTAVEIDSSQKFAAEYDMKHLTDDAMRKKVRGLLKKSLCIDDANAEGAETVAAAIEEAMLNIFEGNGPPYKQKYRNLNFNLIDKKNIFCV